MPGHIWQKKFYGSKTWKQTRALVIQRDCGVCKYCGKNIYEAPLVHHMVELNETNYTDPAVSLNPDLLITLHVECHNIIHERTAEPIVEVNNDLSINYESRKW